MNNTDRIWLWWFVAICALFVAMVAVVGVVVAMMFPEGRSFLGWRLWPVALASAFVFTLIAIDLRRSARERDHASEGTLH